MPRRKTAQSRNTMEEATLRLLVEHISHLTGIVQNMSTNIVTLNVKLDVVTEKVDQARSKKMSRMAQGLAPQADSVAVDGEEDEEFQGTGGILNEETAFDEREEKPVQSPRISESSRQDKLMLPRGTVVRNSYNEMFDPSEDLENLIDPLPHQEPRPAPLYEADDEEDVRAPGPRRARPSPFGKKEQPAQEPMPEYESPEASSNATNSQHRGITSNDTSKLRDTTTQRHPTKRCHSPSTLNEPTTLPNPKKQGRTQDEQNEGEQPRVRTAQLTPSNRANAVKQDGTEAHHAVHIPERTSSKRLSENLKRKRRRDLKRKQEERRALQQVEGSEDPARRLRKVMRGLNGGK